MSRPGEPARSRGVPLSFVAVTRVSVRRIVRDRTALFFMIVLPVFVILIIGATVRGFSTFRVGVVDLGSGRAGADVVVALRASPNLDVRTYGTRAAVVEGVARGEVSVAVVLPAGMDRTIGEGGTAEIGVMAQRTNGAQQAAAAAVSSVIATVGGREQAARFAADRAGGTVAENLVRVRAVEPVTAQVAVRTTVADSSRAVLPEGYSYTAPTMLVLFVFLNGLAAGASIIETRRLGMYERMAAAPIRIRDIIAGESATFVTVALVQSAIIVAIGAGIFGVSWGDPVAALALVVVWSLVGAGAGMLAGSLFRTPEQATATGPVIGMLFGMLGGCMWPLSILSDTFRQIGHAVPHAWAVDAWTDLVARHGGLGSIAPDLGVLAGFAAVFLTLATLRLRRVLV